MYNKQSHIAHIRQLLRRTNTQTLLYCIVIVACGTVFDQHISPFNAAESLKNSYFSLQQTQRLFDEYAQENIMIDHNIVNYIHAESNGYALQLDFLSQNLVNLIFWYLHFVRHPGIVCLCGHAIAENLQLKAIKTKISPTQTGQTSPSQS